MTLRYLLLALLVASLMPPGQPLLWAAEAGAIPPPAVFQEDERPLPQAPKPAGESAQKGGIRWGWIALGTLVLGAIGGGAMALGGGGGADNDGGTNGDEPVPINNRDMEVGW